jgi:hypothetical protein
VKKTSLFELGPFHKSKPLHDHEQYCSHTRSGIIGSQYDNNLSPLFGDIYVFSNGLAANYLTFIIKFLNLTHLLFLQSLFSSALARVQLVAKSAKNALLALLAHI